jgi:UTP--glucose-1-phosphate uridylyltransferase
MKPVRKAVLPVAGLGTRVLPATKTTPKEMLTVVDKPILSYIVEEARAAGIEHLVFVTGRGKQAIEDFFDHHVELEAQLEAKGKTALLNELRADLPKPGEMSFVRQMQPLGLGHAVWCARDIVGDEPFAVMLPDMIMDAEPGTLRQAVDAYNQVGGNIVVVEPCPPGQAHQYGIVALEGDGGRLNRMTAWWRSRAGHGAVQPVHQRPLHPAAGDLRAAGAAGARGRGEIQLTDGMAKLMGTQDFHALEYDGTTYDCGDKIGLLRANVALALKRPDLAAAARAAIAPLLG